MIKRKDDMKSAEREKIRDLIKRKDDIKSDGSDFIFSEGLDIRHSVFGDLDRTSQYRNHLFSFRRIVRNLKTVLQENFGGDYSLSTLILYLWHPLTNQKRKRKNIWAQ